MHSLAHPHKTKVIIFDNDQNYLSKLKKENETRTLKLVVSTHLPDLIQEIDKRDVRLIGMFCGLNTKAQDWLQLVKKTQITYPNTKKFILGDIDSFQNISPYMNQETLKIEEIMERPHHLKELIDKVAPMVKAFESINTNVYASEPKADKDFIAVSALDFLGGSKSYFDLYVKVTEDKYLKILHANEDFDNDRLDRYLKKETYFFYIKKTDLKTYFEYCDVILKELLKNQKISVSLKK